MKPIARMLVLVLISSVVATGLGMSVSSPAFADTWAAVASSASGAEDATPQCEPAHVGSDWRWHENGHGGHWDRWEAWDDGWEWRHYWRDDQYCDKPAESSETADASALTA
jgi:Ni/Co efflux regulator RcnB